MLYLVAQGPETQQRWRRRLLVGQNVVLGRGENVWSADWDSQISRRHAHLKVTRGRLRVERITGSTNPLFFRGGQVDDFLVSPGDHFVIGQTRFSLVSENVRVTMDLPSPDAEKNYSPENLRNVGYRDAEKRIAVLSQLPDVITRSTSEIEMQVQVVSILLTGIPRATTVGIVRQDNAQSGYATEVLHWDQRLLSGENFQPSGTLIRRAVESGETILHLWKTGGEFGDDQVTLLKNGDWAFVSPLRGDAADGLAIYVSGNFDMPLESDSPLGPLDLHDDIKFTELVATTLSNVQHVAELKQRQASLRPYFSPVVIDAIADGDPEKSLAPRECEVSVLFCDLRGFSRRSEQYADNLLELLDRVSGALGIATREIMDQSGVVGDFHGDATMGFWGWPLKQPDSAWRACQAALAIQEQFADLATRPKHPLHDFHIGLGIATGNAVAGRIGTADQVKVTVFGPVVNVAARLETMTQQLRAGILVDQRTHEMIAAQQQDLSNIQLRVRRLAVVQPAGMGNPIQVSQLLPGEGRSGALSDESIEIYETGLDQFNAGNWEQASRIFHQLPAQDRAKDFLNAYIEQHNGVAPKDWNGFISLTQK